MVMLVLLGEFICERHSAWSSIRWGRNVVSKIVGFTHPVRYIIIGVFPNLTLEGLFTLHSVTARCKGCKRTIRQDHRRDYLDILPYVLAKLFGNLL